MFCRLVILFLLNLISGTVQVTEGCMLASNAKNVIGDRWGVEV